MRNQRWKKALSVTLSIALVASSLQFAKVASVQTKAEVTQSAVTLTDARMEELYTQYFGEENVYDRVSVHDPSIVVGYTDAVYDGKSTTQVYGTQNAGNTREKVYFIFGSHMAWAYSVDMKNWTTFTNNINTDYETLMADGIAWASRGDTVYDPSGNMWAPDVFWNEEMGKWCMYMSVNGCAWNSAIVLLTADSLNGDWTHVDEVVYSGFTASGTTRTYTDTDFASVFDSTSAAESALTSNYTRTAYTCKDGTTAVESTTWNYHYGAHAIDPCVTYDDDGNLWMSYGSWSGGIWMFRLDEATGLRDTSVTYEYKANVSDPYMGYKIAGGTGVSGEASYIEKIGDKYWLFISYGGLVANGGYNMRAFSSANINGPYKDIQGNDARYGNSNSGYEAGTYSTKAGTTAGTVGSRLMTYYDWQYLNVGRVAQGHNSAVVDDDGKAYLVYHTRFNDGTEGHQVRVHQLFTAKNGGLVTAPFEYSGETLSQTAYATDEVAGDYVVLYQDPTVNHEVKQCVSEQSMTLNEDGTITGDFTGTWTQEADGPYVTLTINNVSYQGVFIKQNIEETGCESLCFTTVGSNDVALWGCRSYGDEASVVKMAKELDVDIPDTTYIDLELPTEGLYGTTIDWKSSDTSIMSDDGQIQNVTADTAVTMTQIITKGNYSYEKDYVISVKVMTSEDTQTGLVASYDYNDGITNSVDDSQSGTATALSAGTAPTTEYNKERLSNVLHQYFGYSSTDENVYTTSYVVYDNPLKGKTLSGATVSLWVNRENTDVWDAIWSFLDEDTTDSYSGRLYLTPNSYLGYNGTGGWCDYNHPTNVTCDDITPGKWELVTVTLGTDNFGIYINGQLAYDKDNYGAFGGTAYDTLAANMLKVIASAESFYTGYGSWWGSAPLLLDNLKIYDRELEACEVGALYLEEKEGVEAIANAAKEKDAILTANSYHYNSYNYTEVVDWDSVSLASALALAEDTSPAHGTYVLYNSGSQSGNRSAYHSFGLESGTLTDDYLVSMDVQLKNATDRDSQLALATGTYGKKNDPITTEYIWEMTGTMNSTTWTINGTEITIPASTWIHIDTKVDVSESTAQVIITEESTGNELYNASIDFSENTTTTQAAGIYMLNGRSYAVSAFDNIRVKSVAESYGITFHSNDGTDQVTTQVMKIGETQTLNANPFTRSGYSFLGWATSASGAVVYADEASITTDLAGNDEQVILYAVWEQSEQESSSGNEQETTSGNGQETTSGNGQESTSGNEQETTSGNGQETTGGSEQETTGGSGQETTGGSGQETTGGSEQETTGGSEQETTGGSEQETTGGSEQETTGGSEQETTGGSEQETTGGSEQETTGGNQQETSKSETDGSENATKPSGSTNNTNNNPTASDKNQVTSNTTKPSNTTSANQTVKVGTVYTVNNIKYKVTDVTSKTVAVTGVTKKTLKKVTIGKTVTINGVAYKITEIGDKAFAGCKELKKVTIGANVTKIGKKAFSKCKKLKSIVIKSKKLKSIGKAAFKGINKKAKIKVPKKKLKAYKKLLKKKGQASSVKITK